MTIRLKTGSFKTFYVKKVFSEMTSRVEVNDSLMTKIPEVKKLK